MKRWLVSLCCVFLAVFAVVSVHASSERKWVDGKLLDVQKVPDYLNGPFHAVYLVQAGDLVYTVRGQRLAPRSSDYSKGLIVGDPLKVSIEGNDFYLQLTNGKQLKTSILKRERPSEH